MIQILINITYQCLESRIKLKKINKTLNDRFKRITVELISIFKTHAT